LKLRRRSKKESRSIPSKMPKRSRQSFASTADLPLNHSTNAPLSVLGSLHSKNWQFFAQIDAMEIKGKGKTRPFQMEMTPMLVAVAVVLLSLLPTTYASVPPDYLDTSSVVLITGAAGFIGSELAMALHRVYQPKMIVCIDAMDNLNKSRTQEDLALLEYKRQRAFHVMQILGSKGVFYRADFRPSIPEYFDMGEVPILDYIFREYAITHIVHLADAYHHGSGVVQAVPRIKDDIKAGMMESLLEQIVKVTAETGRMPQLTYASSYEVYNYWNPPVNNPNPPPFDETRPITTPSSLRGASKIIDEILGRTYHNKHQIYSLGLRFFPVYGPWGSPGSPLFEMAERAITDSSTPILTLAEKDSLDDSRDYVYIDDAVDALMSAMQFRTTSGKPGVINVGSGEGTTLREIARQMEELMPRTVEIKDLGAPSKASTTAFASTERLSQILRFKPKIPLKEGLARLLAWHYDRAFPNGGRPQEENRNIVSHGVASCSPFDKECLHGAPVYPCVSECSHENQCSTSYYDDILDLTRSLTSQCEAVLYTVALEYDLTDLGFSDAAASPKSNSYMQDTVCNIAFVSDSSPLVRRLRQENGFPALSTILQVFSKVAGITSDNKSKSLRHGFWTLVPISTQSYATGDGYFMKLVPKLSPGLFFGAATRYAIYCERNVIFESIPLLLKEAQMQPYSEGVNGATAMLIGRERLGRSKSRQVNNNESIQNAAYRMIQIGVIEEITTHPDLESSWMVHTLQNEDSRLFRCDVFGEIIQWNVGTDKSAMEFVIGLHDMWSRVIATGKGQTPWWIGDGVAAVSGGDWTTATKQRRRLVDEGGVNRDKHEVDEIKDSAEKVGTGLAEDGEVAPDENKEESIEKGDDESPVEDESGVKAEKEPALIPEDGEQLPEGELSALSKALTGDQIVEVKPGAFMGADGDKAQILTIDKMAKTGEDGKEDDESTEYEDEEQKLVSEKNTKIHVSGYDTWLGIVSSTPIHYFVRIIPSSEAGVVYLDTVIK